MLTFGGILTALFALWLCLATARSTASVVVLHTTDIHGWVDGHRHDSRYTADVGDFASLIYHVRQRDADVLVFDTGDLIQGTGLSDATPISGEYIYSLMKNVEYSALCIGNHDLAAEEQIKYLRSSFVPHWNGRYLAMNVLFFDGQDFVPFSNPYVSFVTDSGLRVLVLGFLYDFDDYPSEIVRVDTVDTTVAGATFKTAMALLNIDIIFVLGHFGPTSDEAVLLRAEVRMYHPRTPLILLTGHTHQSSFKQHDSQTYSLESWWALKTVGVLEFELDGGNVTEMSHQFLGSDVQSFREFAGLVPSEPFDIPVALQMKQSMNETFSSLALGSAVGFLHHTWYKGETIGHPDSIYRLLLYVMYPALVFTLNDTNFLLNTGSVRSDLYAGLIILDDLYVIDPFNSSFSYVPSVSGEQVRVVKDYLSPWASTQGFGGYVPHYYLSTYPPVNTTIYNLMSTDYDSERIVDALKQLYPSQSWSALPYPTDYTSFTALRTFIETFYPTNSSASSSVPPPQHKDGGDSASGLGWKGIVGIVCSVLVVLAVVFIIVTISVGWLWRQRRNLKFWRREADESRRYEALE